MPCYRETPGFGESVDYLCFRLGIRIVLNGETAVATIVFDLEDTFGVTQLPSSNRTFEGLHWNLFDRTRSRPGTW